MNAAALPPADREGGVLGRLLAHDEEGLPRLPQDYATTPYKAKMSLSGIAQPSAGVGVGPFGPAVAGGAALLFSDMLGDHLMATSVQVSSGLTSSFQRQRRRIRNGVLQLAPPLELGMTGGQVPYLVGGTYESAPFMSPSGETLAEDRQVYYRETQRSGTASWLIRSIARVESSFRAASHRLPSSKSLSTGRLFARDRIQRIRVEPDDPVRAASQPGHGRGGLRVRQRELRSDKSDRGTALSSGSFPVVRIGASSPAFWWTTVGTSCRCRFIPSPGASHTTVGTGRQ